VFQKVLIANRGEIALRIHRACKEMGISTVAIHSTADSDAMHVRLADEAVCVGPPAPGQSYLNKAAVISAATVTDADAIHPGYGFLSENAEFAQMVEEHGMAFIGPSPDHIRIMGDKVAAKKAAVESGLPVVPGSPGAVDSTDEAEKIAEEIGYPVLIKASAGGGGRGMKVVQTKADTVEAYNMAQAEAVAAFGNGEVYIEKYLGNPRHIEIQILADHHGNVVYLGERDCSWQRRHQKVLEEGPSPTLTEEERAAIGTRSSDAMQDFGYRNAGTIEYLFENGEFYFIEMNTRLQVEHPVTEMVTGIDIVKEQIRIAAGEKLGCAQDDIKLSGHSIECRINAEDAKTFTPSPGTVDGYHAPGGLSVRVDSALYAGAKVPPFYDSMIAKLIVHGRNRPECLMRLKRALGEFVITGVDTTIPLHQALLEQADIQSGDYDIRWLEKFVESAQP